MLKTMVALAALASLTACGGRSTLSVIEARPRALSVPSGVMQGCVAPVKIPRGIDQDEQWRLWGIDRHALEDCNGRDAAKAATIRAMQAQGAANVGN